MATGLNALPLPGRGGSIAWHETAGEGVPVVFLPGISFSAVSAFLGTVTAPQLRGRRSVLVDYLGSGASDPAGDGRYDLDAHVASVAAVIEALGVGPVPVVGHSMGGTVAIGLALERPDLVSSVLAAEANVTPGGGGHSRRIAAQSLDDFLATGFAAQLDRIDGFTRSGNIPAGLVANFWRRADVAALYGNARMLVELPADFLDRFLALDLPRTFAYGASTLPGPDVPVTPDTPDPETLRAAGVRVDVQPGVGHLLPLEDPEGFAEIVARHLGASN